MKFIKYQLFLSLLVLCSICRPINGEDWPQFQHDQYRTGRTPDSVAPTYRIRWVWLGPSNTIRNHLSNSSWTGPDIYPSDVIGDKATLPTSVPFTLATGAQPIIAAGKVFIGDMDGKVYGINADDGSTLWTSSNTGGTVASGAYGNGVVVFGSISGKIRGYNATNGALIWEVTTKGPITSAPVTNGTVVCVGSHDGHVYCRNITDGTGGWTSPFLGAQVVCGLAMDTDTVYTGAENMVFYALRLSDGSIRASRKVHGQSFNQEFPVVFSSYVFIEAAPTPIIGSEYVMENVMRDAPDYITEQDYILRWYQGDTNGGAWPDASEDWRHLTVLNRSDLNEPFIVPVGPFEGCGTPPEPPVVDNQGRVLTCFKTKYPTVCNHVPFGTNYPIDISAINLANGRRLRINEGVPYSGIWMWETDNLYGRSVGGNYLYLKQHFRGIQCINLTDNVYHYISTEYSYRDGGDFSWVDINYKGNYDSGQRVPTTSISSMSSARVAPAISGSAIYVNEYFCVSAIEHN